MPEGLAGTAIDSVALAGGDGTPNIAHLEMVLGPDGAFARAGAARATGRDFTTLPSDRAASISSRRSKACSWRCPASTGSARSSRWPTWGGGKRSVGAGDLNISPDDPDREKIQIDADFDVPGVDAPAVDTGAALGDVT